MYLEGIGVRKDVDKAIEALERAKSGELYEASSILAHLYLTHPTKRDKTLAYENLDTSTRGNMNMNSKLMMVAYYYENFQKMFSSFAQEKIMNLIAELQMINEIDSWYRFGYRTYYFSDLKNVTLSSNLLCKRLSVIFREH
jgi:hypothetical protein